jgi:peptidoglycan-N-acetylglucosamine deacetylase
MVPGAARRLAPRLEDGVSAMANPCLVAVTVNLHGTSVERREHDDEALYGRFSYGKYAAAVGAMRLFGLLDTLGIRSTVFVPGSEAERHPELVRQLAARHEVAAHGWAMEEYGKDDAAEAELLMRAHESLTRIAGRAPAGWRAPNGRLSNGTLGSLARLGYSWDATFQDDDYPYRLDADGGNGMVEVPQTEMLIDATLWNQRATHDRVTRTWREEIAALYAERCFISPTLHPRSDYGSGRASRVAALGGLLTWLRDLPDVRFVTCSEAASAAREGQIFLRS